MGIVDQSDGRVCSQDSLRACVPGCIRCAPHVALHNYSWLVLIRVRITAP